MMDKADFCAHISHAMWVGYQMGAGQAYNEWPTREQLRSQEAGFRAFEANPRMTAEQNHEAWMAYRLAHGWRYGPVKDEDAKTHPDLVPFGDLPRVEQRKDEMDLFSRQFAAWLWDAAAMWVERPSPPTASVSEAAPQGGQE